MADAIELNEAAVRKRLVDSTSTLTEEVRTVSASQDDKLWTVTKIAQTNMLHYIARHEPI